MTERHRRTVACACFTEILPGHVQVYADNGSVQRNPGVRADAVVLVLGVLGLVLSVLGIATPA
ncbi:hypothetical protein H4687_000255 [Streptomyces stelliscabiei]|uniref:Uncharacterized protein n=1 Tax=Streptomyces stelliscabiei TaxID=146820 RepID=A0A8I0TNT7_9ACTN|nr:hypothetical protein [Streptomyces stelliscabiei]